MKEKELGIYVHIPFCKQKCYYCDFVSFSNKEEYIEKYVETLEREIDSYDLSNYNITTIYIGGGTPSRIPSEKIQEILEKIKQKISENQTRWKDIEITIELNPGTVEEEKIKKYKEIGINRLSIGLQSTNNKLLKEIGRIHTFEDFKKTYNLVKKVGFENINVDLMIGLPNQTNSSQTILAKFSPLLVNLMKSPSIAISSSFTNFSSSFLNKKIGFSTNFSLNF